MPILLDEARLITTHFAHDYPGAREELLFKLRNTVAEFEYVSQASLPKDFKGGYLPKKIEYNGRIYNGRVDVPLENIANSREFLETLHHEVLGHYGVNTFAPGDKRALLDGLAAARQEPTLKSLWIDVNQRYANDPLDVRAEEVFALHCEKLEPEHHLAIEQIRQRGEQSFMETCIARIRPMRADDLQNIAGMVAQGIHDLSRTQQNFPHINQSFKMEALEQSSPARITEPVSEADQRVLDALAVNAALPHLAARQGGLEALRAAGAGQPLDAAQRKTLLEGWNGPLLGAADHLTRLGELAYVAHIRQQAAAQRQSPDLPASERQAWAQKWQATPEQQQQRALQSRNIALREEEREQRKHEHREQKQEQARETRSEPPRQPKRDRGGPQL